jgi:hypothetical protein
VGELASSRPHRGSSVAHGSGRCAEPANSLPTRMTTPAIQSALDALVAAIRADLRAEFLSALGGDSSKRQGRRGRRPGPRPAALKNVRSKGGRRTAEELETLTTTTLAVIKKTPGLRAEQLAAALGVSTKELVRPITKLFEAKAVRTTGQRRGTKYFAK